MAEDLRSRAERRLAAALEAAGAADPRPALRERLRALRERAPDAFDRARAYYEDKVLPALAGGSEAPATSGGENGALASWVAYGRFVGELDGPGRILFIDERGRAREPAEATTPDRLVVHLPDDSGVAAFAVLVPVEPSPAQRAALALLVEGRLSL
jgi:hypothetical protein